MLAILLGAASGAIPFQIPRGWNMSFESIGGTTPILDIQFPNTGEPAGVEVQGADLVSVLAQLGAGAENSAMNAVPGHGVLDDSAEPSFIFYDSDPLGDGVGGGYIEISEPLVFAPEGFTADDLYAVELILDPITGVLTINLCFSKDPLDFQVLEASLSGSSAAEMVSSAFDLGLGDLSPTDAGPAAGSKCTVSITKTTTQTSGSSSWSFKVGVANYTSNSGGTSTTSTMTRTYEGTLVNGRCVVRNGR